MPSALAVHICAYTGWKDRAVISWLAGQSRSGTLIELRKPFRPAHPGLSGFSIKFASIQYRQKSYSITEAVFCMEALNLTLKKAVSIYESTINFSPRLSKRPMYFAVLSEKHFVRSERDGDSTDCWMLVPLPK